MLKLNDSDAMKYKRKYDFLCMYVKAFNENVW